MKIGLARHLKSLRGLILRARKTLRGQVLQARKDLTEVIGKQIVTLDIDSTGIKLVEIKGNRIKKWGSVSFKQDSAETGLAEQELLTASVRKLMNSCRVKTKKVLVSISGLYSVNRMLALNPPPARTAIQKSVLETMGGALSLNMDQLYTSWEATGISEGVQYVFAVSVPRDVIDTQMRALKAAGIHPRILELRPMSLSRAVRQEKAIILNIEPASFDIIIMVKGVPFIIRTLSWHREDSSSAARQVAIALELTTGYYNSHYIEDPIESSTPLFVTGQISGDYAIVKELGLKYPVEQLTTSFDYPLSFPITQYATSLGLALRGIRAPRQKTGNNKSLQLALNLLPNIYQPWRPSTRQLGFVLAIVGCIAFISIQYQNTVEVAVRIAGLDEKYSILNTELQRRQLEIKNRVPIQKTVDEYKMILAKGGYFTEDIETIYTQADTLGVQVKSISHQGKLITVSIEAESYMLFREYAEVLRDTKRFTGFILPPEGYPFTKSGAITFQSLAAVPPVTATPTPTPTPAPRK